MSASGERSVSLVANILSLIGATAWAPVVGAAGNIVGLWRYDSSEDHRDERHIKSLIVATRNRALEDFQILSAAERWDNSAELLAAVSAMASLEPYSFLDRELLAKVGGTIDECVMSGTSLILARLAAEEPEIFDRTAAPAAHRFAELVIRATLEAAYKNERFRQSLLTFIGLKKNSEDIRAINNVVEGKNTRISILNLKGDVPTSLEASIAEIGSLNERLVSLEFNNSDFEEALRRRRQLMDATWDALSRTEDPERLVKGLTKLQATAEWNDPKRRELKADYIPLAKIVIERTHVNARGILGLILQTMNNLALNGNRSEAFSLLGKHRTRILQPATIDEQNLVLKNSDYAMESGEFTPDDFRNLVDCYHPDGELRLDFLTACDAKWFRCRACRHLRDDEYTSARECLDIASEKLRNIPKHPEYNQISSYIDSLRVIIDWREDGNPTRELLLRARAAWRSMSQYNPDDKLMRAGLGEIILLITARRHEIYGDKYDSLVMITMSQSIEYSLNSSVPGHCACDRESLRQGEWSRWSRW